MADDSPFTRERNLSNRNFKKRSSHARRRVSTDSRSSINSNASNASSNNNNNITSTAIPNSNQYIADDENMNNKNRSVTPSTSLQFTYLTNTTVDSEAAFNMKSLRKVLPSGDEQLAPLSPDPADDPALLDVRQKVLRFETLQAEESIIFKTSKYQTAKTKTPYVPVYNITGKSQPVRVFPVLLMPHNNKAKDDGDGGGDGGGGDDDAADGNITSIKRAHSGTPIVIKTDSIDEERSEVIIEDDVDVFSDSDADDLPQRMSDEFVIPEIGEELDENEIPTQIPGFDDPYVDAINPNVSELGLKDFARVDKVRCSTLSAPPVVKRRLKGRSVSRQSTTSSVLSVTIDIQRPASDIEQQDLQNQLSVPDQSKDFTRNYRNTRPKTEIINKNNKNRNEIGKFSSFSYAQDDNAVDDGECDEAELRNKSNKYVQPILDELIKTEETYVENLLIGIENYGNIFTRKDLPVGLRGKKYVLLGNIEQLAEFHRDEFLPMLIRNRNNLKRLFDEFQLYVEENCFYGYVIFTMNKQRSLKLCDIYKNYFKLIQSQLDDKLGINSFLVQPIQRMARYPLLLQQFITTLFKNRDFVMKPLIESCCRLEKKFRVLLTTTNESEIVNDIVDCHDFNVFYQGKFRKVSEFTVLDHTLRRSYRSKVFIFDKCVIFTEIKGKSLIFHGRYPCESIGIVAKQKSFTLYYQQRKQQECEFHGDPALIEIWLELIREMISSFVQEEKEKLKELYSRENDHMHRKTSLSLYRDSNRFSSDSGIGNIWVLPKPEVTEEAPNRTIWYTKS